MLNVVRLLFILGVALMSNILIASNTDIIPREILFGNPDKTAVQLSPNGKYITYLAPKNGVLNIWIAAVDDVSSAQPFTNDTDRGIRSYAWAYDNKHILYTQDNKGDENFYLCSFNIETKKEKILTPTNKVRALLLHISPDVPNQILIGLNKRNPQYFDVYKLNLDNYQQELMLENDKFASFVVDDALQIRFATISHQDGGIEYYQLLNSKWEFFTRISMEDATNTYLLGFDKTGEIVYISDSRDRDVAALTSLNLKTNKTTLIAQDLKSDIEIFTISPVDKTIQAVYTNYDRVTFNILDKTIKDDLEYLQSLEKGDLNIVSRTQDDKAWLIAFDSDVTPVNYYSYDVVSKKAKFLFSNRDDLSNYKLAPMFPVIIKSRDGLDLVSYITYPANVKLDADNMPETKIPLILYVHGGPWVRDSWGFHPVHQWLASRGYAVLSMNYRGSTGFGKKFVSQSYLEWGGKMHDDLIDGVKWAINNEIADPSKIGIMGGSYGGYATLVGMTMTPDIFACGVDIVGISNLNSFIHTIPAYWVPFLNRFRKAVGDWDTEEGREFLRSRSPITFVDNIKKPLLIAQGQHDPRVNQDESEQIVNVMRSKNIPVIYALYPDEGHGFAKPKNRISFYALTEKFLGEILGGKIEPIGDGLKGASLILNDVKNVTDLEAYDMIKKAVK